MPGPGFKRVRAKVARTARPYKRAAHRRFLRHPARVECPVCGWTGPRLAAARNPRRVNRLCPSCGSSERYRALELMLEQLGPVESGTRLLEVAPTDTVRPTALRLGYEYSSIDLRSARAQVHGDLTRLPYANGAFDIVVCFHVLEHVPDDLAAVDELARIVGPGGQALVVVPQAKERPETFEDPDADPADFERLYGQADHVRIYGADILERWAPTDADIDVVPWSELFSPAVQRRHALGGSDDRFWILRRPALSDRG